MTDIPFQLDKKTQVQTWREGNIPYAGMTNIFELELE